MNQNIIGGSGFKLDTTGDAWFELGASSGYWIELHDSGECKFDDGNCFKVNTSGGLTQPKF